MNYLIVTSTLVTLYRRSLDHTSKPWSFELIHYIISSCEKSTYSTKLIQLYKLHFSYFFSFYRNIINQTINVTSVSNCSSSCVQNQQCLYFAYNQTSNECFLKSEMTDKMYSIHFISGPKNCRGQSVIPTFCVPLSSLLFPLLKIWWPQMTFFIIHLYEVVGCM